MGDITKINGAEIEPVDVITFGSPCQDLSIAGLRKGLAGSRSGLYVQAVRVIREMLDATNREYPKFVVFENVPGMLSSNKGNDFIAALDMMSELRFIPDPNIHDAQYCGVPQRRRRIGIAWANIDAILRKRTILSDSIMLQCLSEILLIDLVEALQVFSIEPKGQQYRVKWLSEDGRRRRIELFSLQKGSTLQMWQQCLDEMQATYQNAQGCSDSTVGEAQMDFFTLMAEGTNTDAKMGDGSISIERLLNGRSGENSNQPSGCTTLTWIKGTMPSKICTCFQALLGILALTGAYISSAAKTNSDVKSYFEWVLSILTLTKEYINARQANGTSVAKLVGDDVLRDWNIRLQACEDKVVADFGGDTASEIQFDGESLSGDIAAGGTAGEGTAEAAEGDFNPAVGNCMTAWDCQSKRIFDTSGKSPTLQGGIGGGVNNPAIFHAIPINDKATRWQGGGESRNHDGSGNGLGVGKEGDPSPTLTAGDRHGVMCMNPWDSQSARVYDKDGVWHSLNANENGGMARDSVLCAGFKLGNSEQARSIGYQEELSPTLNAECGGNKPAVVAPTAYSFDSLSSNSMKSKNPHSGCREVDIAKTLNTMHDAQAVMCADVSHALRAKANCAYREDAETYLVQNMVVRRLTPMECERLQGYPDHWTDIGEWTDDNGKKHKDADSPRYKALGNSIALPFWEWMLRRMARYLPEGATLGSLFDGISGFNVCWARIHGAQCCRWSSEIEQFPIAVVKKHFGDEEAGKEGDFEKFFGRNKKKNV